MPRWKKCGGGCGGGGGGCGGGGGGGGGGRGWAAAAAETLAARCWADLVVRLLRLLRLELEASYAGTVLALWRHQQRAALLLRLRR